MPKLETHLCLFPLSTLIMPLNIKQAEGGIEAIPVYLTHRNMIMEGVFWAVMETLKL